MIPKTYVAAVIAALYATAQGVETPAKSEGNVAGTKPVPGERPAKNPPVPETIDPAKELFIIASEVINSDRAKKGGPWHIRGALQRIAGNNDDGTPVDVEAFAQAWFKLWAEEEKVEGTEDKVGKRPWVAAALAKAWSEDRIRLIAIVNRLDLTKFRDNDSTQSPEMLGEGRFVYEVMADATDAEPFTLIFEYRLPNSPTLDNVKSWANRWHALGKVGNFGEEYLTKLEAITNDYSAHGQLNQIRTNEFLERTDGSPRLWELREFRFDAANRRMKPAPVNLTPAFSLNDSDRLRDYVRSSAESIIGGRHVTIPAELAGAAAPTPFQFSWKIFDNAAEVPLRRASFIVSFNSCNGCHSADTGTLFQHIGKNAPQMSAFLREEITLKQPLPGNNSPRHNEMGIRRQMMAEFLQEKAAFDDPRLKANIKARRNRVH